MHLILIIVLYVSHSMYFIIYIIFYSFYSMHCILCILFHTAYFIHFVLCIVFYSLYCMHCILYIVFHALYSMQYILCMVWLSWMSITNFKNSLGTDRPTDRQTDWPTDGQTLSYIELLSQLKREQFLLVFFQWFSKSFIFPIGDIYHKYWENMFFQNRISSCPGNFWL